jgi:glycosyltransferase involved in cell wall biosynthesis
MTRALLITKLFYPVYGGVETAVAQIAEGIARDDQFKLTVLAGNEKVALRNTYYDWRNAVICKTAAFGTIFNTALSFHYPFALRKLIRANDVFHFHVPNPLGELSFYFNKIPANKKVIVTVHADVSQTRRKFFSPVYNIFLRKLLDRADVITTMTPQNRDGFSILQPYLTKTVIVPLAYDAQHVYEVSNTDKITFCRKYNIDQTKKIVLFVGRLSSYKGVDYLLKAVSAIDGIQLVIAGDGELKSVLVSKAARLDGKVIFTGFINGHDMACAYSIADVFVLPSTTETFGIVQAEAMRFGVPVINTALNTGVNYVSVHDETGLTVPPANDEALKEAIKKITGNEVLRKQFSENAIKRSELFAPEIMIQRFKELYT